MKRVITAVLIIVLMSVCMAGFSGCGKVKKGMSNDGNFTLEISVDRTKARVNEEITINAIFSNLSGTDLTVRHAEYRSMTLDKFPSSMPPTLKSRKNTGVLLSAIAKTHIEKGERIKHEYTQTLYQSFFDYSKIFYFHVYVEFDYPEKYVYDNDGCVMDWDGSNDAYKNIKIINVGIYKEIKIKIKKAKGEQK